jgi:hypothetical protein
MEIKAKKDFFIELIYILDRIKLKSVISIKNLNNLSIIFFLSLSKCAYP